MNRETTVRVATFLAIAFMTVGATVGAVRAVRHFDDLAASNDALDYADREVAWGNGWTLSQPALYAARSLIPSRAPYQVSVGSADRFDDPLTPAFVSSYLRSFLMPRHQVERARWIVCYRCDRPPRTTTVWEDADVEGIAILRRTESSG